MRRRWGSARAAAGLLVAAVALAGVGGTAAAAGTDTSFTYVSQSGDYIGQGRSGSLTDPAAFRVGGTAGHVTVSIDTGSEWWSVELAAPRGRQLVPGDYQNVTRAPFNTTYAGLSVTSTGRGCNAVKGWFTLYALSSDTAGRVTSLDASFTQFCDAGSGSLSGTVHYAAPAAAPVVLSSSDPTTLDGQPVTLTARVQPGTGPVAFRDGSTVLGQATPDAQGLARLTTAALAVGTHSLTVSQGTAVSAPVTQTVTAGGTSAWFRSGFGEYIGQGATESFVPSGATLTLSGTDADVTLSVDDPSGQWWRFELAAPPGQRLRAGTYDGAVRAPFRGSGQPGLDVTGSGRGCNTLTGTFTVDRIVSGPQGSVESLDATFTQYCEGGALALTGRVRWNAGAPDPVPTSTTTTVDWPRSAKAGRTTALLVTVTGAGPTVPTGTARLYDGASAVGDAVPLNGGKASIVWTPAAKGQANLVVRYSGDERYLPSSSETVTVRVN